MTKQEKIRLYYGVFLGVLTVIIGLLFIIAASEIYFSGPRTGVNEIGLEYTYYYSRELVGQRLLALLAPVCIWILAVIAGFALSVVYPLRGKPKVKRSARETVFRLSRRMPAEEDAACYRQYRRARKVCSILRLVGAAVCLASAVVCAVYIFNTAHFAATTSEEINPEILSMLKNVLPFVGLSFACCIAVSVYDGISAKKELPVVKRLIADGRGTPIAEPSAFERNKNAAAGILNKKQTVFALRAALVLLAVFLIVAGVVNGGAHDVLVKAINICTECIGLG